MTNASLQRIVDAARLGRAAAPSCVNSARAVAIGSTVLQRAAAPNSQAAAENVMKANAVELMMMRAMRPLSAP
jgi:hypothetical protein